MVSPSPSGDALLQQRDLGCWMLSHLLGCCGKSPSKGDPLAIAGAEIKALLVEFWFKSFSPKEHFGELSPTLQATTVPRTFWHIL